MSMIIEWEVMKDCMGPGGPRHGPPGGPGGPPPPPPDGEFGPPPPPPDGESGPPPPPPESESAESSDTTNSASSEQGGKGRKGGPRRGPPGGPGHFKERMACDMECAFGKINAIKDGAVDQQAFEEYVVNRFKDNPEDPWKDVATNAVKTCGSADAVTIDQEQKCKSGAGETMMCMHRQMFKNCPESNWQNTDECNACRESEDKCPYKRGGKGKGRN
ncbi:hypothetical protein L9F63_003179 [Diploptera punctata]|uniref:OBP47-like domain-containing protein n=1 Tax=Diploptera punctata TaxID=6984 RepID=A0AAD7ZLB7_DIPPU|nr:hypothetical protein L9F63_003179 [Diploptera punctata]